MSIFEDRTNAALLVIDVQVDVVSDAWHRDEIIANINSLVARARVAKTPVIWVQHCDDDMEIGTDGWQLVPELKPLADEPLVLKRYRSSFENTVLEETLAQLGVGTVYISGSQSNFCVRHTAVAALERGYDVVLVEDAHTTSDGLWEAKPIPAAVIVAELNQSLFNYQLPGRSASLVKTSETEF